ncbi:MAG: hypothetical protein R3F11_19520 [Verrucomicrobiales bacterium]
MQPEPVSTGWSKSAVEHRPEVSLLISRQLARILDAEVGDALEVEVLEGTPASQNHIRWDDRRFDRAVRLRKSARSIA